MQIKKERKQTYRYSYTQLVAIKPAKAPGQDSIGTGGQNSIGANTLLPLQPSKSSTMMARSPCLQRMKFSLFSSYAERRGLQYGSNPPVTKADQANKKA